MDGRCRGCGHHLDESTDPDAEGDYEGHSYVCFACAALDAKQREFRDAGGASDSMDGRKFTTTRILEEEQ